MAPSHSTPQQCAKTINQIIALIKSFDNNVLLTYHDHLARRITQKGVTAEERQQHAIVCQLMALKIQLQYERNQINMIAHYQGKEPTSDV